MNLEIRHLRLIVAIHEEKSVTRAGERLHLSQSALSHQLRDIEERLGTPLFLRSSKRMIVTQAGQMLLESAKQVLEQLQHTEDQIGRMALNRLGTLRLSTECYTCYHWLPAVLKEFGAKYPEVEVRIVVEATRKPIASLLDGKLDLAIVTTSEADKRLMFQPLFGDELVAIAPRNHWWTARSYVRPRDFEGENLILHVPTEESTFFQKLLRPAGVKQARVLEVQLTEAIIEMVKAGLGVSVQAKWAVKEQIESGKLAAVPVTRRGFQRQWSAAMLRSEYRPEYLDFFVDLLARPSMPLGKPGIVRLVSGRKQ